LAPIINFIKNNVDVETDEKNQAEKAAKTKQNPKSKLALNTWALTLKTRTTNKFARCH
jgi:hypothetical protein